jgi:signal peptidase II
MNLASRQGLRWLLLAVAAIAADQLSKYWIVHELPLHHSITLLPVLNLMHMHNTGVAFSMFNHAPPMSFVALSVGVSVVLIFWLLRHPPHQRLVAAALALILGGALGNAIDRFRFSYVVDFIDFHIGSWHFATFNVADSAITIGAALLVLDMLVGVGE